MVPPWVKNTQGSRCIIIGSQAQGAASPQHQAKNRTRDCAHRADATVSAAAPQSALLRWPMITPRTCLARGAQRSTRAAAVGCAPRAASGRIGAARRGHSAAVAARARPLLAQMGLLYCALPTHDVPETHGGAQRAVVGGDIAQIGQIAEIGLSDGLSGSRGGGL